MASITDQNWVVWNQGKNPLVNFNFMLRVELMFDLPCKSVRAFERELEYDFIQEGGLNDYVHMRRKPISKPFTLEVERYVGVDYIDPMPLGADLVLPVMLFVSRNHDQFIPFVVARTYVFTGCTVMKKTYGDLVADQSGLLVETTTLGYREMLCVDIPWSEVGDNISKDINYTPAKPTDAKTRDRSAEDYKLLAQQLYEQAQEAKLLCDDEFKTADAEALLKELEKIIQQLEKQTADGGPLQKAIAAAEAGLKDASGKEKKTIAAERQTAVATAKGDLQDKKNTWKDAYDTLETAQKAAEELEVKKTDLEEQLARLKALLDPDKAVISVEEVKEAGLEELLPPALADQDPARRRPQNPLMPPNRQIPGSPFPNRRPPRPVPPPDPMKELRKALEKRQKQVEDDLRSLTQEQTDAKQAIKTAEAELRAAEKKVEEAQKALKEAEEQSIQASYEATAAQQALADAQSALKKSKTRLNQLRNNKTNLDLRKERAATAQKNCGDSFENCETENTKVQAMTDEQEIYNGYETVSKHAKNTSYYERQVRETAQHMESARKLLDEIKATLPAEEAETDADASANTKTDTDSTDPGNNTKP